MCELTEIVIAGPVSNDSEREKRLEQEQGEFEVRQTNTLPD